MKFLDSTPTILYSIIVIESYLKKKFKLLAMVWKLDCHRRKSTTPSGFSPFKSCFWNSNFYKNFASSKDDLNFFWKKAFRHIKNILKKDSSIVVSKTDKVSAIAILNKTNSHFKMDSILNDSSKLKIVSEELFDVLIKK